MRRFTLLLCLLVVAVLGWVIRSGEACTAREHVDAVPPKDAPGSEGCKYVFSGYLGGLYKMRGSGLITYQQLSPAIELRPQSGSSILSRLNQRVRFELTAIAVGRAKNSFPSQIGRYRRVEPICNVG